MRAVTEALAARPCRIRSTALTLLAALALCGIAIPAPALGATPKTSLTAIWNEVMCTSCGEPLSEAQSPQAQAERQTVQMLVNRGYTKAQIERVLVAQYGPAVLGRPPAHGFNLVVYIVPPAAVALAAVLLALALPRWRRRTRARAAAAAAAQNGAPRIDPRDAERLEADLAQFG